MRRNEQEGKSAMKDSSQVGEKFQRLVGILAALRGPGGCPWDREQDERSIADYFLEEVFEAVDALFRSDPKALAEELGDVLMEVVFLSQIFEEKGEFDVSDTLDGINEKLIRRHPHVFGGEKAESAARVLDIWVRQKKAEKKRSSHFEGLPTTAPALLAAFQIGRRAAQFGFDWPAPSDALEKVREELAEIEEALKTGPGEAVEEEIGDGLFALAQAARLARINPEIALRRANAKFMARFAALEAGLGQGGKALGESTLEEMEAVWNDVKKGTP
jgi:MazG family protein